jgi:thiol-disulfide isomerase/thioredoxin
MMTALVAIVATLALAAVAGWLLTRRSGAVRAVGRRAANEADTGELCLSRDGPTVVHFSAAWCAPCARVRRVVSRVCDDLADVTHVEVDMDANPDAARRLSVLSLPTTFIFDVEGRQRYRTTGVPKADDLRSALTPLLA